MGSSQAGHDALASLLGNPLKLNEDQVFECLDTDPIAYSDGRDSERYLARVFSRSDDLSSGSSELEAWIRDWPSEYHLSRKRAQLFSCFEFDSSASVLELGCGCGAITRFLGENFQSVVSVEGARARAALARQRCRDLDSVSIVCAPFQALHFKRKFDLIVCVGVFEYSNAFVDAEDPYAAIMAYFSECLAENGVLLLAIENQFGLKYFASASEDHTGTRYDGIEGYHRFAHKGRTFGRAQLSEYLQPHFSNIEYYFPFPDYKIPDAVFSEALLEQVDASPLLARFRSRDYLRPLRPSFDERLAWRELSRNGQASFFAHSFLIVASKQADQAIVTAPNLAVMYNRGRAEPFHTRSRIFPKPGGAGLLLEKQALAGSKAESAEFWLEGYTEDWQEGETVHEQILRRALLRESSLEEIFLPAAGWLRALQQEAGEGQLSGSMIDAIWQNSFHRGGANHYIDLEWRCRHEVSVQLVLIRSLYWFLVDLRSYPTMALSLRWRSGSGIIKTVAAQLGMPLAQRDLDHFLLVEPRFRAAALGRRIILSRWHIWLVLLLPQSASRLLQRLAVQADRLGFYAARGLRIARRLYHGRGST